MKIFEFCAVEVSSRLAPLAIAITAVLVTQPVFAVPDHQLVFTENSSSSLSVTYDRPGVAIEILNLGSDRWQINFLSHAIVVSDGAAWQEQGDPNYANIMHTSITGDSVEIDSDTFVGPNNFPSDGYTYTDVGTDSSDSLPIDVTFHDIGDTVPDTGTTCSLFGLSLMGLAFLRRKVC